MSTSAPPPAPAPPPAAPPPPPAGYAPSQPTSGFAVASLVLGLCFWCTGFVTGILAVVFGNVALDRIAKAGGQMKGRGMAIAGIVLGWIGIALAGIAALAWLAYGISNL